ncbi:MAG: MarR family transcriptional regulator [Gammaproteobacteria bacterium]|nr:MarR family transcriptional regulator [Gammaproteobacteria bacterium]
MTAQSQHQPQNLRGQEDLWLRYRSNLPRHCIGVARYLQSSLMHALTDQLGHRQLRLNFEPYLVLVGEQGARPGELAEWLAISKQACNQTINQIEAAGYLARTPDPLDGRARIVVLTEQGRELLQQGSELLGVIEGEFAQFVGAAPLQRLIGLLARLYRGLDLPALRVTGNAAETGSALGGLLPRISDHMMQRLMELTRAKGHPGLKMSYAQVLTLIGPEGGRIQQMARIQEVSKQAIAAVAKELQALGYIRREADPADARQLVLILSDRGLQLLTDSVESVAELERELQSIVGPAGLAEIQQLVAALYRALHLEEEIFGEVEVSAEPDLPQLASRLTRQLGQEGAAELARLLAPQAEVLI